MLNSESGAGVHGRVRDAAISRPLPSTPTPEAPSQGVQLTRRQSRRTHVVNRRYVPGGAKGDAVKEGFPGEM